MDHPISQDNISETSESLSVAVLGDEKLGRTTLIHSKMSKMFELIFFNFTQDFGHH